MYQEPEFKAANDGNSGYAKVRDDMVNVKPCHRYDTMCIHQVQPKEIMVPPGNWFYISLGMLVVMSFVLVIMFVRTAYDSPYKRFKVDNEYR